MHGSECGKLMGLVGTGCNFHLLVVEGAIQSAVEVLCAAANCSKLRMTHAVVRVHDINSRRPGRSNAV